MKVKILSSVALLALALSSCVVASGNSGISVNNGKDSDASVKKEIKISSFSEIQASQGIKVIVSQGQFPGKVSVATTPSAEEFLQVKVNDGTLKVFYDSKGLNNQKIKGPSIITVIIPQLDDADLSSGACMFIKGSFNTDNKMDFDLSSGSSLNIEDLSCRELSIDASSGASVMVENFRGDLDADSSSGSSISVKEAKGGVLSVDASSGSSISLQSKESAEIRASASSGASISISGRTERFSRQTSSGGSVNSSNLTNSR